MAWPDVKVRVLKVAGDLVQIEGTVDAFVVQCPACTRTFPSTSSLVPPHCLSEPVGTSGAWLFDTSQQCRGSNDHGLPVKQGGEE